MRTDLESAMAAVITSWTAVNRLHDSPDEFGRNFLLNDDEQRMLEEMGPDLSSLTGSFVAKRRTMLEWGVHRTIEILGVEGDNLLDVFVDTHPQTDSFRRDTASLSAFMIDRTAESCATSARHRVASEMARFEAHRLDAFWDATSPLEAELPAGQPSRVRLVVGSNIAHFELDVRTAFRCNVYPWSRLRADPCELLFYRDPRRGLLRTLRLRAAEALVVSWILRGETVAVDTLFSTAPPPAEIDRLLQVLTWEGALEWV